MEERILKGNELQAEIKRGNVRICPNCNGEGKCKTPTIVGYSGGLQWRGNAIWGEKTIKCPTCNGKGYQEKSEEWK